MNVELELLISQIVCFIIMLLILKRFAWKPLLKTMEDRKKKIQAEFDLIATEKAEIKSLTELYHNRLHNIEEEAREKINEAVVEARKIAQQIHEETHLQAKAILSKAKEDVEQEIAKAKAELKKDVVNLVVLATGKLLDEKLDTERHKDLINDFVEKAQL